MARVLLSMCKVCFVLLSTVMSPSKDLASELIVLT